MKVSMGCTEREEADLFQGSRDSSRQQWQGSSHVSKFAQMSKCQNPKEETLELREAIASGDVAHIADELGDMLFVLTNLARHYKLDAEALMLSANQKFDRRFRHMEDWLASQGLSAGEVTLEQMEDGWRDAKQAGK